MSFLVIIDIIGRNNSNAIRNVQKYFYHQLMVVARSSHSLYMSTIDFTLIHTRKCTDTAISPQFVMKNVLASETHIGDGNYGQINAHQKIACGQVTKVHRVLQVAACAIPVTTEQHQQVAHNCNAGHNPHTSKIQMTTKYFLHFTSLCFTSLVSPDTQNCVVEKVICATNAISMRLTHPHVQRCST